LGATATHALEPDAISIRGALLAEAAAVASREGLEALTLNHLGTDHGMNRSDLFRYFGCIDNLRIEVIEAGIEAIEERVFAPCADSTPGLPGLYGLMCRWLDYLEDVSQEGSCYLFVTAPRRGAQPSPVRIRLANMNRNWIGRLQRACDEARELGHLRDEPDTDLVVTELHASLLGAHWSYHALGDQAAFALGRQAVERRIRSSATAEGLRASKARLVAHAEVVPLA
jgi:AcrR family transcriptional regulator